MSLLRRIDGTTIWRTPEVRFDALSDYPFDPHYVDIDDARLGALRMHYIDENPRGARVALLLHGEPSWSYLYRFMVPPLVAAGFRVVAPDLLGFGKSDKPGSIGDYSYAGHVGWMHQFLDALDLRDITLFCQDWGGLIGLRTVADKPEKFARLVIANTGLPEGKGTVPAAFRQWQRFARWSPWFPIGKILQKASLRELGGDEVAAYDAPFPNRRYKAGTRAFPLLVPTRPDDPGAIDNRDAWQSLERFERPVLTLFSDRDPVTRGGARPFQDRVPGAKGQPHETLRGGGHFLQEDLGLELAARIVAFAEADQA
ncbi:MAG: haloalkane dehalogenase [Pseudomonadota bacterium]